jgi:prepilin-type N-terminal cleavage/methylation domain-containing protein
LQSADCRIRSFEFGDLNSELEKGSEDSAIRNPQSAFQSGFTLIEIIIVIVVLSIISVVTINFLVNSVKTYSMMVNQKTLLDEGKLALERMCRDIRDARSIIAPAAGESDDMIRFIRANDTAQDRADETIRFRRTGNTLEKDKASPNVTRDLASNVSNFTVTRGAVATNNEHEITLQLTLSLASGENVTLQTKVYPKNLLEDTQATYRNFYYCWKELHN